MQIQILKKLVFIVGAMYYAKENKLYNKVVGNKGVFAFVVSKKEKATALPNYEPYRQRLDSEIKNKTVQIFQHCYRPTLFPEPISLY